MESVSEIEALRTNGGSDPIQDDEIVRVAQPDTPYALSTQIKFDSVSNVTIEFEDRKAADGNAVLKAADGSNVGGFWFGLETQCSDVRVVNYGFDGNHPNQDQTVKRLHGILVNKVDTAEIVTPYLTRTSPYQEHNSGGSGISIEPQATDVIVKNPRIDDIGDRGIQFAGDRVQILGGYYTNGYDRHVAAVLQRKVQNHNDYAARDWHVESCFFGSSSDGSFTGVGSGQRSDRGYGIITDCQGVGTAKSFTHAVGGSGLDGWIKIVDNEGRGGGVMDGVWYDDGEIGRLVVQNNHFENYVRGFRVTDGVSNWISKNNEYINCDGPGILLKNSGNGIARGDIIKGCDDGIYIDTASGVDMCWDEISNCTEYGIALLTNASGFIGGGTVRDNQQGDATGPEILTRGNAVLRDIYVPSINGDVALLQDGGSPSFVNLNIPLGGSAANFSSLAPARLHDCPHLRLQVAPSAPNTGDQAMQDGTNWNPTGSGNIQPVYYDGTAWGAF